MSAFAIPVQRKESYLGINKIQVKNEDLDQLYREKKLSLPPFYTFNQNEYIVVKSIDDRSALARFNYGKLHLLDCKKIDKASDIVPKNKEQYFAMDALTDDNIRVVCLTGRAGTGKTIAVLAAALRKIDDKVYDKIIISRPMSQVGNRELGILPGDVSEKINPYLINYMCNLEVIFKNSLKNKQTRQINLEAIFKNYNIEVVPLQLMRGASFNNSFVIVDESQVMDYHETLTLGTRISEGSKLIIMGDLNQRDERISKEKTGLFKFINDKRVKGSHIAASVELQKCERGEVSELFSNVFED